MQPLTPTVVRIVDAPTTEMSYGAILASAVGLVGIILLASALVGIVAGGVFIAVRKLRRDSSSSGGAAQLHLNSLR